MNLQSLTKYIETTITKICFSYHSHFFKIDSLLPKSMLRPQMCSRLNIDAGEGCFFVGLNSFVRDCRPPNLFNFTVFVIQLRVDGVKNKLMIACQHYVYSPLPVYFNVGTDDRTNPPVQSSKLNSICCPPTCHSLYFRGF